MSLSPQVTTPAQHGGPATPTTGPPVCPPRHPVGSTCASFLWRGPGAGAPTPPLRVSSCDPQPSPRGEPRVESWGGGQAVGPAVTVVPGGSSGCLSPGHPAVSEPTYMPSPGPDPSEGARNLTSRETHAVCALSGGPHFLLAWSRLCRRPPRLPSTLRTLPGRGALCRSCPEFTLELSPGLGATRQMPGPPAVWLPRPWSVLVGLR